MPAPSNPQYPPDRCPLCGQPNACVMEQAKTTGQPPGPCWCMNASFSADLLARVPPAAQREACICATCAALAARADGAAPGGEGRCA